MDITSPGMIRNPGAHFDPQFGHQRRRGRRRVNGKRIQKPTFGDTVKSSLIQDKFVVNSYLLKRASTLPPFVGIAPA